MSYQGGYFPQFLLRSHNMSQLTNSVKHIQGSNREPPLTVVDPTPTGPAKFSWPTLSKRRCDGFCCSKTYRNYIRAKAKQTKPLTTFWKNRSQCYCVRNQDCQFRKILSRRSRPDPVIAEFPQFAALPTEIRLLIFRMSLGEQCDVRLLRDVDHLQSCSSFNRLTRYPQRLDADSFRRTCREAYAEITPLIWSHYNFRVSCFCAVRTILSGRDPVVFRNLRNLTFNYTGNLKDARLLSRLALCEALQELTVVIPYNCDKTECSACQVGFVARTGCLARTASVDKALSVAPALQTLTRHVRGLTSFKMRGEADVHTRKHHYCPHVVHALSDIMTSPVTHGLITTFSWLRGGSQKRVADEEVNKILRSELARLLAHPDLDRTEYEQRRLRFFLSRASNGLKQWSRLGNHNKLISFTIPA